MNGESKFKELEEDIVEFFKTRYEQFAFPVDLNFLFLSNNKQKNQLIKISKIPEQYAGVLNKELLVTINEDYFYNFDDETNTILIDQEIDNINIDFNKGTIKISKPTIKSNKGIIDKYTWESVNRALEVERLFEQQKKDKE